MGNSAQGACDLSGNVWEWVLPLFPTLSEMTKWPTIFRRRTSRIEWPNDDVHSLPVENPSAYPGRPASTFERSYFQGNANDVYRGDEKTPGRPLAPPLRDASTEGSDVTWALNLDWLIVRGGGADTPSALRSRARSRRFVPSSHVSDNIGFRCAFIHPPTCDGFWASR